MPWQERSPGYFTYTGRLAEWMAEVERWGRDDVGQQRESQAFGTYLAMIAFGALRQAKDKWSQEWLGKGKAAHATSLLERGGREITARHVIEILDYLSEHLELSTLQNWSKELRADATGTVHRLTDEYVRLTILFASPDTLAACVPPGWWTDGEPTMVANGIGLLRYAQCKPPATASDRPLSALELIGKMFAWPPTERLARLVPPDRVLIGLPASGLRLPISRDDVAVFTLRLLQEQGMQTTELMQLHVYQQQSLAPAGTSPAYLAIAGRLHDVPETITTIRWSGR
jgi:hypothetical protein